MSLINEPPLRIRLVMLQWGVVPVHVWAQKLLFYYANLDHPLGLRTDFWDFFLGLCARALLILLLRV